MHAVCMYAALQTRLPAMMIECVNGPWKRNMMDCRVGK